MALAGPAEWGDYIYEVKAPKISGVEGFIIVRMERWECGLGFPPNTAGITKVRAGWRYRKEDCPFLHDPTAGRRKGT